jgi:putative acetyltransferase
MEQGVIIRPETEKDYEKIKRVNDLAFGQKNEGLLVEKLRQTSNYIPALSLVAELNNEIVGHILFYPVSVHSSGASYPTLSLGPMAVIPAFQRKGVGRQMVFEGLEIAKSLGHDSVIVIGHPEYYPRFGFRLASKWDIKSTFEVPVEVFMAIELVEGALQGKSGTVEYPKEFEEAI